MVNEDDLLGLSKVIQLLRAISVILLMVHIYWFCWGWMEVLGWNLSVVDKILWNFQQTTGLFSSPIYTKIGCLIFLALSILGTKSIKNQKVRKKAIIGFIGCGFILFFFNGFILSTAYTTLSCFLYVMTTIGGFLCLMTGGILIGRLMNDKTDEDPFNDEAESFWQETRLVENEYSVNLPTKFYHKKLWHSGFVNVVNCFRSSLVCGLPGSGKSHSVINQFIKQHIEKGFAMMVYDYKFDDLSVIAYNHLLKYKHRYAVPPTFHVLNFDDPRYSHRCNPLNPAFMTDISDAYESSFTVLLNLNKTWIEKSGDFFVESAVILYASIIWFLRIYQDGKYCTFPHSIELLNKKYSEIFTILSSYPELENYLSPFMDAWKSGAQDQLQGQIASAKIPLSRMISPQLYWVMSGDDFSLKINDPQAPKILAIGNNPLRQNIYGAALGLYNSRIVRLINQKGRLKCSLIIDELPTIYFRGLDNLIATARSNKVSVCLGVQDFSQLTRDYGEKESKVIQNTVGNIFSGQVVGETAKTLSERFGKIMQRRESVSINNDSVSTSISSQLETMIPASKISTLSQGMFVGAVADNFGEAISQKIFHCQIVVDNEKLKKETDNYVPIPQMSFFQDENGNDNMEKVIADNYRRIKTEVDTLVKAELKRIQNDPSLKHLLPKPKKPEGAKG